MAITLAEANKLALDAMLQGVIETIIKDDPLLETLPFVPIVGNSLLYNRENAAASAAFFDVGDAWTESTPTFTQVSTALKILGGDADVDNFLARTRANVQDLEAAVIQLKAKAVADKLRDTLVNGDTAVDAKSFDGLDKLIGAGAQQITMGVNGATLTLAKLDELIDTVLGGKPDLVLMSKRSRRTLNSLFRASGAGVLPTDRTEFGNFVELFNGIPVVVSDYISDAKTVGSSADCSTIYAFQMGEGAFAGLSSRDTIIEVERVGSLETKDATRTRVKAYVSCALFSTKKAAKLIGVRP
ncbi:MAG: phage major capsid protein [Chloroflexi bacterium]|nr:phage major capsid protein [Chloroflexota bacterium]